MNRHIHGPVLDMSERYRQTVPIKPDRVVPLDTMTWVTHYEGLGALAKRKRSGTRWAVGPMTNRPPPVNRARQSV
jgi:hypothetical protein